MTIVQAFSLVSMGADLKYDFGAGQPQPGYMHVP
jgi:hypothetical protein